MAEETSLARTRWDCACHVVWVPKCRHKVVYGEMRRGDRRDNKGPGREGGRGGDSGGRRVRWPRPPVLAHAPKHAVCKVVGRLKGRSSIMPRGRHPELAWAWGGGKALWARGYYVSTVGLDGAKVRGYIRRREEGGRFEWGPFGGRTVTAAWAIAAWPPAVPGSSGARPKPPAMPGDWLLAALFGMDKILVIAMVLKSFGTFVIAPLSMRFIFRGGRGRTSPYPWAYALRPPCCPSPSSPWAFSARTHISAA